MENIFTQKLGDGFLLVGLLIGAALSVLGASIAKYFFLFIIGVLIMYAFGIALLISFGKAVYEGFILWRQTKTITFKQAAILFLKAVFILYFVGAWIIPDLLTFTTD